MISIMISSLLLSFVFILPGWTWTDSLYPASNRGRHGYGITPLLAADQQRLFSSTQAGLREAF
jgi:hypothetical protein